MGNTIDIHIHLDKGYPPDPTGDTDYAAAALVAAYALVAFVGNLTLACVSRRWKSVQIVNVPLVIAMSFFSICHLGSIYLDMAYIPALTEAVQSYSCVVTAYWGEYMLGLGGFLGVLGLRAYSLLMISVDLLRPKGARYRRTLLKGIFFAMFLLPVYSVCLLISVDEDAQFDPALTYCTTPNEYKISMVAVLVGYMVTLTILALWLARTDVNPDQARPILNIIAISVPLLAIACVIHFTYMLPHAWGRFAFMFNAFVLHTFAYARIVVPAFYEYVVTQRSAVPYADLDFDLYDYDDTEPSEKCVTDTALFQTEVSWTISEDIKWILSMLEGGRCRMTADVLMRFPEIRDKFFTHCKLVCTHDLVGFKDGVLTEVDVYDDDGIGMPVWRLLCFFNDIHDVYTNTKTVYSSHAYLNAQVVGPIVRTKLAALRKTYLDASSTTPVNLPKKLESRLRYGFTPVHVADWDIALLTELMSTILEFLIVVDSGGFGMEFDNLVYAICEKYGEKLDGMDAEGIIDLHAEPAKHHTQNHFQQFLRVLEAGPSALAHVDESGRPQMLSINDDIYGDNDDIYGTIDDIAPAVAPAADERVIDEYLADGSVIYSSATRAALYFIYDFFMFFIRIPHRCAGGRSGGSAHADDSAPPDGITLVDE